MQLKQKRHATILLAILLFAFAPVTCAHMQVTAQTSQQAVPNGAFSIAWITDTQYLSESNPAYYDDLCQWIVNNTQTYNIQMVIHNGDMIDDPENQTQWENAKRSMSRLLDAQIPYCWDAGNHDTWGTDWIGNQYHAFNATVMQEKPYWVSSVVDARNTAVKFQVGNWTFLIVNIEYEANSTVLDWANHVLDQHPSALAIVAAHAYLDTGCQYDSWAQNFSDTVLATHSNVFLTLSGHYGTDLGNWTVADGRYELMFDRQYADNKTGSAAVRILTFNSEVDTLEVKTYVVYLSTFLGDSKSEFVLDLSAVGVPEFLGLWVFALTMLVGGVGVLVGCRRFGRH